MNTGQTIDTVDSSLGRRTVREADMRIALSELLLL